MSSSTRHRPRPGLVRLGRNCWVPQSIAHELVARCAAVLDSSAQHCVISSVTAARLHGLWLPDLPDTIHVATATPGTPGRSMTRTKRGEFTAHRFQLDRDDMTVRDGLPVTTPARTWRDLAGLIGLPDLVAAGDSVLRSGASVEELQSVLERTRRVRHARRARLALSLLDKRSRSRPESHLRVAVSLVGLPTFQVNEPVYRDEGGWLAEPDLSLPEAKLALEYQGAEHASIQRMRKDITRGTDMRMHGWLSLPFGPAEVFGRPWSIGREVFTIVLDRAPELVRGRRRSTS